MADYKKGDGFPIDGIYSDEDEDDKGPMDDDLENGCRNLVR